MIVFNSSTLILLAKAGILDEFLVAVNQRVVIPREVERESCEEKDSMDSLIIRKAIQDRRISVRSLKDKRVYTKISEDFLLGLGEAQGIALALSAKAKLFATDDGRAIQTCKLLKIPFTTAIDILIRLYEEGIVSKDEAHLKLAALVRYGRYKRGIVEDAISKLEVK